MFKKYVGMLLFITVNAIALSNTKQVYRHAT